MYDSLGCLDFWAVPILSGVRLELVTDEKDSGGPRVKDI